MTNLCDLTLEELHRRREEILSNFSTFNGLQQSKKIALNSLYGACG